MSETELTFNHRHHKRLILSDKPHRSLAIITENLKATAGHLSH